MASPHVSGFAALLYDKFRMRTQQVVPPGMLFGMVKSMTVDINELGIDDATGAGFITFYPDIPQKREGKWIFPDFNVGMPDIARAGRAPRIRAAQRPLPPHAGTVSSSLALRFLTYTHLVQLIASSRPEEECHPPAGCLNPPQPSTGLCGHSLAKASLRLNK
jgi:hypothetical protein